MSCTIMGRSDAPKRVQHIAPELPDDLIQYILLKNDFKSKVNAAQVCKKWDQLLKANSVEAKHWGVVCYHVNSRVSSQTDTTRTKVSQLEQFEAGIGRWVINRAGAIKSLQVSARLSFGQQGVVNMKTLESYLPLLAGCLSEHNNTMDLIFYDGSPFASLSLSSTDFLAFMCPMVKTLRMDNMKAPITASQFAAMCELSMLETLHIHSIPVKKEQRGLQEITEDVSKLVNLTSLVLISNSSLRYIPESISSLQQLGDLSISGSPIRELPLGLGRLANLSILYFDNCGPLRFPRSLQGLEQLTVAQLTACHLKSIPKALCDIPSLTSLDLAYNRFVSRDGWPWWPTTLSRLTKLANLDISECDILSLPPHISGLRGLKELCVGYNHLTSLPEEMSCLQCLEDLQARGNRLAELPVSMLSVMTSLRTINLGNQRLWGGRLFKIPTSLLPILHPELIELDVSQYDWDALSLCHLGRAMVAVAKRTPPVKFLWHDTPEMLHT